MPELTPQCIVTEHPNGWQEIVIAIPTADRTALRMFPAFLQLNQDGSVAEWTTKVPQEPAGKVPDWTMP